MKKRGIPNCTLVSLLVIWILGSSCATTTGSDPSLTMEFTGCDFAGATVALVEFYDGTTEVAYGYGALKDGEASFPLHDVHSDDTWYPTIDIIYNVRAYCFNGSAGDPVPSSGYWRCLGATYEQYQDSEYSEMGFEESYFAYVP